MKRKLLALILLAFNSVHLYASSNSFWSAIAEQDLKHIYETVKQNHPGYTDPENPYFKKWLETGYTRGLKQAATVTSLNEAMNVLSSYVAGFADGHFTLRFDYQPRYNTWAGVVMAKKGVDYQVIHSEQDWSASLPPKSSTLISCDDIPVTQIMNQEILAWRFNNPALNFPKVLHASRLFIDDGVGVRQHFKHCLFNVKGSKQRYEMKWQKIKANELTLKAQKGEKLSDKFFIEEYDNNNFWVNLPKFSPNVKEQEMLAVVINKLKVISKRASIIVLDVRGNGGGNSQWGIEIAKALYGELYIENFFNNSPDTSYSVWRASNGNFNYLKTEMLPHLERQFGVQSKSYQVFSGLASRMKQAITENVDFVRQTENDKAPISDNKVALNMPSPIEAQIVLLTDSSCGSACLDFTDLILKQPNVLHLGQETGADTVYMDIRAVDLPSGLGKYSLAQKVYRNRVRKHNESYVPKYQYLDDISNTLAVKKWIHLVLSKAPDDS